MRCPHCGARGLSRAIKRCQHCGEAYVAQDLEELSQLGFLVEETAGWEGVEALRLPYVQRLEELRARLLRREPAPPEKVSEAAPAPAAEQAAPVAAAPPALAVVEAAPEAVAPVPPKERVPFDQWLLSERNIKIALYAGAALLVLAGLIFVGASWRWMSGPAKFATMVMATGLMYLAGYLLFRSQKLRIAGIALLGIASGFVVADLSILQIYVLGPAGLRDDVMWLIASPLCLVLYVATAYWTRGDLFTYTSLAAVVSAVTAALVVADAPSLALLPVYALLAYGFLWLERAVRDSQIADFTAVPLRAVAQGGTAALVMAAVVFWVRETGCETCRLGSPWLAILALGMGVVFYVTTDVVVQWRAARWAAAVLLAVAAALALVEVNVSDTVSALALMGLALVYLGLGYALERREGRRAGGWPLYATAYAVAFLVTAMAVPAIDDLYKLLFVDVVLLVLSAAIHRHYAWIYGAAVLFAIASGLALLALGVGSTVLGLALMLLALAYLGAGYALERREGRRASGWPLYATAYAVALLVTATAIPEIDDLYAFLFADVVLLVISAAIQRHYGWIYAAVWLFMLPVYLVLHRFVPSLVYRGLLMGLLGLNYAVAGYVLGQRSLWRGGAFLGAAACLSIVAVGLTWTDPVVASLVLGGVAVLYLVAALWRGWTWLLLPALLAVHLLVLLVNRMLLANPETLGRALTISYAVLGLVLGLGALILRRLGQDRWSWPLYLLGGLDLLDTYLAGLVLGGPLAVGLSVVVAEVLLGFTWLQRAQLAQRKVPTVLTYLGIAVVFVGHFYVLYMLGIDLESRWPPFTAALCAVFVLLAALLRRGMVGDLYGTPLRRAGLSLLAIPLLASVALLWVWEEAVLLAITYAIAGLTYEATGVLRRVLWLTYLGIVALVVVIWGGLMALEAAELQAYVLPAGLTLLGIGWHERRQGRGLVYQGCTVLGLVVLMGSAFAQSLGDPHWPYALLLLAESLAALAWGVRNHLRRWVQIGGVALLANGVGQFGPAFVDLSGWIQLGLTGAILLGIGIVGLLKREEILAARRRLVQEWREWQP